MINLVEYHVVDHCNLNCRGCAHFAPVGGEHFADVDEFIASLTALTQLQTVAGVRLMGGEPLLHPRLLDFTRSARVVLGESADVRVMTNGLLLRDACVDVAAQLRRDRVTVEVTRYPLPGVDYDGPARLLRAIGVTVNVVNDEVKTLRHHRLDVNEWPVTDDCVMIRSEGSLQLRDGKLYRCPITAYVERLNVATGSSFDVSADDVLDLSSATPRDVEHFVTSRNTFCGHCAPCTYGHPFGLSERRLSEWTVSDE